MQVMANDYKLPPMPEVTCFTERSREDSFLSPDMQDLVPSDQGPDSIEKIISSQKSSHFSSQNSSQNYT